MTKEIWKTVQDYPKYEVSTHGRVRRLGDGSYVSQVLTGIPQYYYVNLRNDEGVKLLRVHRLVATEFIDNPDNLPIVDHKDKDRFNNNVENLRWTCRKGNARNTRVNIWLDDGRLLARAIEQDFPDDIGKANSSINQYLKDGYSYEEAKKLFTLNRKTRKVEWEGEEIFLYDLCEQYGKKYKDVSAKISTGWPVWNALYNCPPKHPYSIQTDIYWYPSKQYILNKVGISGDILNSYLDKGVPLDEVYNNFTSVVERFKRQYTVMYRGEILSGSMSELEKKTGMDEYAIRWRDGKLTQKAVIKYKINNVIKRKSEWCRQFGLCPRVCTNTMSRKKISFKEYLILKGVDVSNMKITPV